MNIKSDIQFKTCTKCNVSKPVGEGGEFGWSKNKRLKAGGSWKSYCKTSVNADNAAYYAADKDKRDATIAVWQKENQDRYSAMKAKSYAIARSPFGKLCIPDDFDFDKTIPFYAHRNRLNQIAEEAGISTRYEVDHVCAIINGGNHCASNMRVVSSAQNLRKFWEEDKQNNFLQNIINQGKVLRSG